ncbi:hypothetical protein HaLaN_32093, partial [Haematococcus lacustris]
MSALPPITLTSPNLTRLTMTPHWGCGLCLARSEATHHDHPCGLGALGCGLCLASSAGVKQLYLAEVRGPLAVIFAALVNGSKAAAGAAGVASARIVATGKESGQAEAAAGQPVQGPSARVIDYPPLSKALGRSVAQCGGRRPVHPLYQV